MGDAPDIPPEEPNLTHVRTITALVGSMQRVQHEVDEISRQFAASLFRLRSSFDLIDRLFHTAGEAAARLRDNLPKNWPHDGKLLNDVWRVLAEDGIPIVCVPRAEIVRAILEEDDYDSRMKCLWPTVTMSPMTVEPRSIRSRFTLWSQVGESRPPYARCATAPSNPT
jgi:hypothetical protein